MSTFIGIPRMPASGAQEVAEHDRRVVRMACSLLLDYPGDEFSARLAAIRAEVDELPAICAEPLRKFCQIAEQTSLRALQEQYVETFDQRRRCALGLTYYSHGDTRDRGQALLIVKELMRSAGFEIAQDELPDYLPLVLEFCALDETGIGEDLLRTHREGIEVIRTALRSADSPWSYVLDALVLTLPPADERAIEAYHRLLSQGPPSELVGVGDLNSTPSPLRAS